MSDNPFMDALVEIPLQRHEGTARRQGLQEGRKEGRKEGREEGAKAGARAALLRLLRRRFGEVGELVEKRIGDIDDLETIERLVEEAAVAPTLEAFLATLPPSAP